MAENMDLTPLRQDFAVLLRLSVAVGNQFVCGEGFWMVEVSVKRWREGRPLLHEPYPRMASAVDSSLVAFGLTDHRSRFRLSWGMSARGPTNNPAMKLAMSLAMCWPKELNCLENRLWSFSNWPRRSSGEPLAGSSVSATVRNLLDRTPQFLLVLVNSIQPAVKTFR